MGLKTSPKSSNAPCSDFTTYLHQRNLGQPISYSPSAGSWRVLSSLVVYDILGKKVMALRIMTSERPDEHEYNIQKKIIKVVHDFSYLTVDKERSSFVGLATITEPCPYNILTSDITTDIQSDLYK
jgi:hypothetical protein